MAFNQAFGEEAEIVATVICGDSYFNENVEAAKKTILDMISSQKPDCLLYTSYSGAGKSTLAKKLGRLYDCPVLYLDRIQFEPGWKERNREEAKRMAEEFLNDNQDTGWIIDGNYAKFCQERRLEEADLIVFMDYTRRICLWQAVKRYLEYRDKTRELSLIHI